VLPAIVQPTAGFGTPAGVWVEREIRVMGTHLVVRVEARDQAAASSAAEAAVRAVERTDDLLSTWRPDAELARFNRTPPGRTVSLSAALDTVLREVRTLAARTGGAFDPTIGALVDAWDLRGAGRVPGEARLCDARAATGWDRFTLGPAGAARADPAAWLDSGGFGKGAALRAARDSLTARGVSRALLNFGGQIVVIGATASRWRVAVADPAARGDAALAIELDAGSVATSGQSERALVVEGRLVGHILDPRSGHPVPAWGSVTVVDPDPLRADVLATALFVLGPAQGWAWAETHHIAALFVTRDAGGLSVRPTPALPSRARVIPERT